ncbi:hypothetical protein Scep_022586 [Stephania cephalantha]|uniref:Uncharacterized protein n=1 Tax=Stephania cephalantha TaxID=152367 RepID=A0AAP0F8D1_9MAGN
MAVRVSSGAAPQLRRDSSRDRGQRLWGTTTSSVIPAAAHGQADQPGSLRGGGWIDVREQRRRLARDSEAADGESSAAGGADPQRQGQGSSSAVPAARGREERRGGGRQRRVQRQRERAAAE